MSKQTIKREGELKIHTENIFPIIKKWLYSDHEIFLRELISNAFDAITKLDLISKRENLDFKPQKGQIQININETDKTITISDNGIGLTADEIETYINQIAFSGAEDFLKKYKDKSEKEQIIGHFGLGFYSAFMVSDLVEINSLSYQKNAEPVKWNCDGTTRFSITKGTRKEIGTDIILHINSENEQYLKEERLKELVTKYANFLPVEIKIKENIVNDQNPLWLKSPADVKEDKEYLDFYQKLYPFSEPPLFWIHLNVDYPFNLKGILYFPKILHELDSQKGQVKLFCQQVFVTDNSKEIIPEFLTLLRGTIDSPDIPLNVSRSYLQNDPYVQKISKHIIKKVADKLNELYKKDKDNFEKFWLDIHPFIKFGMMQNDDFYEKVKDIVIFKSSLEKSTNITDYLKRNEKKLEKKILYSNNKEAQATYLKMCKDQDLEVIFLDSVIDTHFIQFLETKNSEIKFVAVDSELSEHLIDDSKTAKAIDKDEKTMDDKLAELIKQNLNNDKLKVEAKSLKTEAIPAMLIESEQIKRMKNMSMFMNQKMPVFEDYTFIVNTNNAIVKKIQKTDDTSKKKMLTQYIYDLARISQNNLKGNDLNNFVELSNKLISDLV